MSKLELPYGFRIAGDDPGDDRFVVPDVAARTALLTNSRAYLGMFVYQTDTSTLYQLTSFDPIWVDYTNVTADVAQGLIRGRAAGAGTGPVQDLGVTDISTILINDAGTGVTDLLSGSQVDLRIANAVASNVKVIGDYDADLDTPTLESSPGAVVPAIVVGHQYIVTTVGSFYGVALEIGDSLIAKTDGAPTLADWIIVQANIVQATDTILGSVRLATVAEVNTGTNGEKAIVPSVLAGSALQLKMNGIEDNATADQTGAEIKAAYILESKAYTDAQFDKLYGIEAGAQVNVPSGGNTDTYMSNGTATSGEIDTGGGVKNIALVGGATIKVPPSHAVAATLQGSETSGGPWTTLSQSIFTNDIANTAPNTDYTPHIAVTYSAINTGHRYFQVSTSVNGTAVVEANQTSVMGFKVV